MTVQPDSRYDLKDLAARGGVTARTVHFYIQQGLLPPAGQSGPGARYSEAHLARLLLIRRLQREHLPLAEIRNRLRSLDDDAVRGLAASTAPPAAPPPGARSAAPPETSARSALDYIRGLLKKESSGPRSAVGGVRARPDLRDAATALRTEPAQPLVERLDMEAVRAPAPQPAPPVPPALSMERSQWDHLVLSPDIELHIRRPLTRDMNKRVERLVQAARKILQEGDV